MMEEYVASRRWRLLVRQPDGQHPAAAASHLTMTETGAEMISNVLNRHSLRRADAGAQSGFAFAAIVPIALGIGINTRHVLRAQQRRLASAAGAGSRGARERAPGFRGGPRRRVHGARAMLSIPEYRAYRDQAKTLAGLMAYSREWTVTLGREAPERDRRHSRDVHLFRRARRLRRCSARASRPANCGTPDAPPAVVLSHALWQGAFGGDPRILERPIVLNGREVSVVGVAPAGFEGVDMAKQSFFAPTAMASVFSPEDNYHENPHVSWLTLIGRRRDNVDLAQVRADLSVIASGIDQQQPGRKTSLIVEPAVAPHLPSPRQAVLRGASIVMAAFGFVLLIAAANVANLLLARAAGRTREIAIRSVVRRFARPARAAAADRKRRHRAGWRGVRPPAVLVVVPGAGSVAAFVDSRGRRGQARCDAGRQRAVVRASRSPLRQRSPFGLVPALQGSKSDVHTLMKQDGAEARSGGRAACAAS